MRDRGAVTSWRQRRTPLERVVLLVVVVLVLGVGGCYAVYRSSNPRLDADDHAQVRDRVQRVGDEAIAAASAALGVEDDREGERTVGATSCSGAPDGFVRLGAGETFVYPRGSVPAGVDQEVERAWSDLGLDVVRRGDSLVGESMVGDVRVSVGLGPEVRGRDGSGRDFRRVSVGTGCFDVGSDRARDLTR